MSDFKIVKLVDSPVHLQFAGGINPTGEYDEMTAYELGDGVSYEKSSYVAIQQTTGNLPTDPAYWQLLAEQGIQGEQGVPGNTGQGVAPGGSTCQALVKKTDNDFETEWVDHALDTDGLREGSTNKYFTDQRAKDALNGMYDPDGTAVQEVQDHESTYDHSLIASALQSETDPLFTAWDKSTGISITESQISDLKSYLQTSLKGANNGLAELDAGGKIPSNQLPSSVMEFKGTWNATTNTPALADGTGDTGDVYLCSVAGTQDLGSGSITFAEGDWVVYNGTIWQKSINSNAVVSVNGQQGVVVLNKTDIGLGDVDNTSDINKPISTLTQTALDNKWSVGGDNILGKKLFGSTSNQDIGLITNNTERITILKDGNVGIGTDNPVSKFEVMGTTANDIVKSAIGFDINVVPNPTAITGEAVAGSGLEIGDYFYLISYYTSIGETAITMMATAVKTTAGNQAIKLTIPTSPDPRVIGRVIYRAKVNEPRYLDYFLTRITNNIDTEYIDTLPDNELPDPSGIGYFRMNTTSNYITIGGKKALMVDVQNAIFGYEAGLNLTTGGRNTLIGTFAGRQMKTGLQNVVVGDRGLFYNIKGSNNISLGYQANYSCNASNNIALGTNSQLYNETGSSNISLGTDSLSGVSGQSFSANIALGSYAGNKASGAYGNVLIGHRAGEELTGGAYSVVLGLTAGQYQTTGSHNLYFGYNAGSQYANNDPNTNQSRGIVIGSEAKVSGPGATHEIVIGHQAVGNGAFTATYGNTSMTKHIFPAGNVGVGTTNPYEKLEIDGNIKATGYKSADGSAGASGSFTSQDGKTITVKNGLITNIA